METNEVLLGCAICGEVTRHVCPYSNAPMQLWRCENEAEHSYVLGPVPRSNIVPLLPYLMRRVGRFGASSLSAR